MLFREIITADYGKHTEHTNTALCVWGGGGTAFFNFIVGGPQPELSN